MVINSDDNKQYPKGLLIILNMHLIAVKITFVCYALYNRATILDPITSLQQWKQSHKCRNVLRNAANIFTQ